MNASDLVPVSVFMGIARRVRTVAAEIARAKNVPLRSTNEIGIQAPKVTQAQIEIDLTLNQRLSAYEWGSGIHRTKKTASKYPIVAKNAPFLVFEGTNMFKGQTIVTPMVMHPGVAPRPFLEPAKRQTRKENLDDIRKANLENMRLIIRGMARKV